MENDADHLFIRIIHQSDRAATRITTAFVGARMTACECHNFVLGFLKGMFSSAVRLPFAIFHQYVLLRQTK